MSWYFSPSVVCSLAVSFLTIYSNCVLIDTCFSSNIMPEIHVVYAILKKINAIMPHCFKWYQSKRSNQHTGRSIKNPLTETRRKHVKPFPKHDSYHVFKLSVWWGLLVAAEPYHFFTCFRQVSVEAKRCFRRCNFVLRLRKHAFLSFPLTWSDKMSTEILSYFSETDFSHVFTELFRPRGDGNTCEGLTLISLMKFLVDTATKAARSKDNNIEPCSNAL